MLRFLPRRQYHIGLGGIVYIVVALFIGMAAINSQANLLFWSFGLMLAGLMVSGVVSGFMMLGLDVRRLMPDHGAVDQPMTIHYELTNRKRLLPCFSLIIQEQEPNGRLRGRPSAFCLHVGPGTTGRADAVTWPEQRGNVQFRRVRVSTTFPFGIIRKSVLFDQPARVVVHPKIHPLDRSLLTRVRSRDPDGSRATHDADGSEEFFGLREYRAGDSLRYIHWRHSARIGQLVSREMTRLSPPRLMVVLNVRGRVEGDADAEQALSFAASLMHEAHQANEEVGLVVLGARCPAFGPQHSRWHLLRMLYALGELRLGEQASGDARDAFPPVRDARWLAVHAGEVDRAVVPGRAIHFSGGELDRYRLSAAEGAADGDGDGAEAPAAGRRAKSPPTGRPAVAAARSREAPVS